MARVFIGVGSNIDRELNIQAGVQALYAHFSNVQVSRVYESSAVGFEGDNFLNLVVRMETDLPPRALQQKLHEIEASYGRSRGTARYVSRTLDLDLLLYDDVVCDDEDMQLPREDVTRFAFVLRPLSEIAGELRHPVLNTSYRELWQAFEPGEQELWAVDLALQPDSD